jgi:hypothetical protein
MAKWTKHATVLSGGAMVHRNIIQCNVQGDETNTCKRCYNANLSHISHAA